MTEGTGGVAGEANQGHYVMFRSPSDLLSKRALPTHHVSLASATDASRFFIFPIPSSPPEITTALSPPILYPFFPGVMAHIYLDVRVTYAQPNLISRTDVATISRSG